MEAGKYGKISKAVITVLAGALALSAIGPVFGGGHEDLEIKQGMREDDVNDKYGQPVLSERIKEGFLPIPKKKSLYKIDGSTYMILRFFSGRINEVTILEDVGFEEASSMFGED